MARYLAAESKNAHRLPRKWRKLARFSRNALSCVVMVLYCLAIASSAAVAEERDCRTVMATVDAGTWLDFETACEGARDAFRFIAQMGVAASASLHVNVVERLPKRAVPSAAGIYVAAEDHIYLLS